MSIFFFIFGAKMVMHMFSIMRNSSTISPIQHWKAPKTCIVFDKALQDKALERCCDMSVGRQSWEDRVIIKAWKTWKLFRLANSYSVKIAVTGAEIRNDLGLKNILQIKQLIYCIEHLIVVYDAYVFNVSIISILLLVSMCIQE